MSPRSTVNLVRIVMLILFRTKSILFGNQPVNGFKLLPVVLMFRSESYSELLLHSVLVWVIYWNGSERFQTGFGRPELFEMVPSWYLAGELFGTVCNGWNDSQ